MMGKNERSTDKPAETIQTPKVNRRKFLSALGVTGVSTLGLTALSSPVEAQSLPRSEIVISGIGDIQSDYRFVVDGDVDKGPNADNSDFATTARGIGSVSNDVDDFRFTGDLYTFTVDNKLQLVHDPSSKTIVVNGLSSASVVFRLLSSGQFSYYQTSNNVKLVNESSELSIAYGVVRGDSIVFEYTDQLTGFTVEEELVVSINEPKSVNTSFDPNNDREVVRFGMRLRTRPDPKQIFANRLDSDQQQAIFDLYKPKEVVLGPGFEASAPNPASSSDGDVSTAAVSYREGDYRRPAVIRNDLFKLASFTHRVLWKYNGQRVKDANRGNVVPRVYAPFWDYDRLVRESNFFRYFNNHRSAERFRQGKFTYSVTKFGRLFSRFPGVRIFMYRNGGRESRVTGIIK